MLSSIFNTSSKRSPPVLPTVIQISNRLLYYSFESNNANDSWNTNHGTLNGACITNTRAKNGTYSCTSNGVVSSSVYIQTPAITYTTSNGLSFSFWFYRSASTSGDEKMFEFTSESIMAWSGTNAQQWNFANCPTKTGLSLNTWYHGCVTITSAGAYTVYHNGVSFYSGTITALNGTLPSGRIGRSLSSAHHSFMGNIDEFKIYNKVLTQAEISGIYANDGTYI